jgi:hemolysin-activating ACP:hemolysin acyltransferase
VPTSEMKEAAPELAGPDAHAVNDRISRPTLGKTAGAKRQARVAQAFSQIVAVLMRDPAYRNLTLADLEELVLPPLMAGQYRVAHATTHPTSDKEPQTGLLFPVALALWARVSPAVDARLSENLREPLRLRPAEWVSGDIAWLVVVAGHPRAVPEFLKQLTQREFKGKKVKMRLRETDGKVSMSARTGHHGKAPPDPGSF